MDSKVGYMMHGFPQNFPAAQQIQGVSSCRVCSHISCAYLISNNLHYLDFYLNDYHAVCVMLYLSQLSRFIYVSCFILTRIWTNMFWNFTNNSLSKAHTSSLTTISVKKMPFWYCKVNHMKFLLWPLFISSIYSRSGRFAKTTIAL